MTEPNYQTCFYLLNSKMTRQNKVTHERRCITDRRGSREHPHFQGALLHYFP